MRPAARPFWPLLGAAALWLPLAARWSHAWMQAPDQAFGWGVPVLALYLFAERWRTQRQPWPQPPAGARWGQPAPPGTIALFAVGCLLVLTDLPVLESNALWPTAQFWGAAGAVLATFSALASVGGWRWARQFLFPPLFIFTALTWPTPIKTWIVGTLSGANAQIAAALVSAAGHPAVVSGNVIAVSTGLVGIEEACSGLRSLQTVWMVSWFAGEFFLLNLPRRFFLVFSAVVVALAANLARTLFLTWLAAAAGLASSERWHDRAGNLELAFDLAVVAALAWRAHRGEQRRRHAAFSGAERRAPSPTGELLAALRTISVIAVAVGLAAEAGTRLWYGLHSRSADRTLVHWRLQSPAAGWKSEPVPAREVEVLQSTSAAGLSVQPPASNYAAWVFVVNWEGDAARSENPEWHDPAICLPASGGRLLANLGTAAVPIGDQELRFAGYRFDENGHTETVYFCHWDAETAQARVEVNGSAGDVRSRRWQRVIEGRREGDVAHLAFVIETEDTEGALTWLRHWAPLLLHPVSG